MRTKHFVSHFFIIVLFSLTADLWAVTITEEAWRRGQSEWRYLRDSNRSQFIGFGTSSFEHPTQRGFSLDSQIGYVSLHEPSFRVVTQGSDDHPVYRNSFLENLQGLPLGEGETFWAEIGGKYHLSWLHFDSSFAAGGGDKSWWQLRKAFAELRWKSFVLSLGRKPLYWGRSGRAGLLISNNAQNFDLISLSTLPVRFPGWLSRLGYFKSEVFASRLDEERVPENDWLVGWRFGWKPVDFFEMNTALLYQFQGKGVQGGSTRNTLLEFLGARGRAQAGEDQGGGLSDITNRAVEFDLSFRIFQESFPSSIYTEQHFEDCCGDTDDFLKHSYSYIYGFSAAPGVFLVSLEYVKTASALYSHPRWASGSSYQGRLFGNPLGADAQAVQLFGQTHLRSLGLKLRGRLWWEERRRTGNSTAFYQIKDLYPEFEESEKRLGILLTGEYPLPQNFDLNAGVGLLRVTNRSYEAGRNATEWATNLGLSYSFRPLF